MPPLDAAGVTSETLQLLKAAALNHAYVSLGSRRLESVHEYYRYPARFSPSFARAAIESFSNIGEVVLDPFVGGGTTLVEARLLSRIGVGADINPLATFVSRAKTAVVEVSDLEALSTWGDGLLRTLRLSGSTPPPSPWEENGYLQGLGQRHTWRIRDLLVRLVNDYLPLLEAPQAQLLARCAVLRTAQWALDMRSSLPGVPEFRDTLVDGIRGFASISRSFAERVRTADDAYATRLDRTTVVHQGLPGLAQHPDAARLPKAALVVTSPPYPGVYVLYHRWKLQGRQEIPAPFWLTQTPDGRGMAHYTMSARARQTLDAYFEKLRAAIKDIAELMAPGGWFIQLVGFSDVREQLSTYLDLMAGAGLREVQFPELATGSDGRLWRNVPSRRWWVTAQARRGIASHTAREVVLIHRAE